VAAEALCGPDGARRVFKYAEFPVPALPPVTTLWRGTTGLPLSKAAAGVSWGTNRDAACFYAMILWRRRGVSGRPLVVRPDVPSSRIIYWVREDDFSEVMTDGRCDAAVDGDADDWAIAAARYRNAHLDLI
jgi:hypothetical protein